MVVTYLQLLLPLPLRTPSRPIPPTKCQLLLSVAKPGAVVVGPFGATEGEGAVETVPHVAVKITPTKTKMCLRGPPVHTNPSPTRGAPDIRMGLQIHPAAAIGHKDEGRLTVRTRWSVDGPVSSLPDLKIERLACLVLTIKSTFKTFSMEA